MKKISIFIVVVLTIAFVTFVYSTTYYVSDKIGDESLVLWRYALMQEVAGLLPKTLSACRLLTPVITVSGIYWQVLI